MARREIIPQFKQDAGLDSSHVIPRHTQFDGKAVNCMEGCIQTFIHQKVRIIVKQLYSAFAVDFISTNR